MLHARTVHAGAACSHRIFIYLFIYDAIRKETDEVHCEFIHTPSEKAVKVFELDYGKY